MVNIPITSRLKKFAEKRGLTQEANQSILKFVWPFIHRNPLYQALKLHKIIDSLVSKETGLKCKQFCSNCCKQEVSLIKPEADLINSYLRKFPTEFKNQGTSCGFLHNDKCAIYSVRPATCRSMISRSDPKYCLPSKKDLTKALSASSEIIISGIAKYHPVHTIRELFSKQ